MARRLGADGSKLEKHTKKLRPVEVGTSVSIQNQTGRSLTKWDKTGIVIENKPFSKVVVRIDGSRRVTTRNRRFVRVILPPQRQANVRGPNSQPREDAAQMDDDDDYQVVDDTCDQHRQAPVQQLPQQDPQPQQETPDEDVQLQEPAPEEPRIPQTPPRAQGPPLNDPDVGGGPQCDELPQLHHPLQLGARSPSPLAVQDHVEDVQPNANERLKLTIRPLNLM